MVSGKLKNVWLVLLAVAVLAVPVSASKEPAKPGIDELKGIIDILEDPGKRDRFITHLKGLAAAWSEPDEKPAKVHVDEDPEPRVMGRITSRLEDLSVGALTAGRQAADVIAGIPAAAERAWKSARSPDHRDEIRGSAYRAVLALIAMFGAWVFFRRVSRRLDEPTGGGLALRVMKEAAAGGLRVVPFALLISVHALLAGSFPSVERVDRVFEHLFVTALLYRAAIEILRLPLSPHRPESRILRVGDEYANYWWLWIVRLINYGAFFFLVSGILQLLVVDMPALLFMRGILIIPVPLMISVLLMQIGRELRLRFDQQETAPPGQQGVAGKRMVALVLRYAPALSVVYVWLVSIYLITSHREGFVYLRDATVGSIVTGAVLFLTLRVKDRVFKRFFLIGAGVKTRFPDLEEKANRFIVIAQKVVTVFLIVVAVGVAAQLWGIPVSWFITSKAGTELILRGITILATLLVAGAVIQGSSFFSDYLLRGRGASNQKVQTLVPMLRGAVKIATYFIAGVIILQQFDVNTTPILAGAGILGLAVGFGAQTLVKDLINGIFIIFEETVRVGDFVDLGGNSGVVEAVGLRTVRLRDVSGNVHVVPNSAIDRMINYTKDFSRVIVDVGVAYREDVEEVVAILIEVGNEMRADEQYGKYIIEPMEVLGLDRFEDSAVVIRVRFTTTPMNQWMVRREFNKRLKRVFDDRGIEIPFPHRTIYIGEAKDGSSPPLRVNMEKGGAGSGPAGPVS